MEKVLFFARCSLNKGFKKALEGELMVQVMCHFPGGVDDSVTCSSCQDLQTGVCDGKDYQGEQLLDCMISKIVDPTVNIEKRIKAKRKYNFL